MKKKFLNAPPQKIQNKTKKKKKNYRKTEKKANKLITTGDAEKFLTQQTEELANCNIMAKGFRFIYLAFGFS